jgi:acyl transferase domain-containing protein/acyl carrier protein
MTTDTDIYDSSYDSAIALVGMAGRWPGASDVQTFWNNIASGICSVRSFSDEELLDAGVDPALLAQPNYVKAGAPLADISHFDAAFFGYSPREAETMDPQHRLFLECCWEALEHAACDPAAFSGPIAVFAGSPSSTYLYRNIMPHKELVETLGQLQIDTGNDRDSLASTVSYKLNLRGPAISVQTCCSTSLVAVHLACQSLLTYECDLALAGGVSLQLPHGQGYLYEDGGILSPDGHCRTFDAHAQGSIFGSGVGVVTLKRFRQALSDGDTIYALLRGSAINNDGSLRPSYTAPSLDGQASVILAALSYAEVPADTLGYIEAHGTATPMGDAIELAAMRKAFATQTSRRGFCALGSVKPNMGHLDRASGVTGLIKAVMALYHRQLPPSLYFTETSPEQELSSSPFYVNTKLQDWQAQKQPRRAGVSSFGLGGTNAHVVLEEAPARSISSVGRSYNILPFSAKTAAALQEVGERLAEHLQKHPDLELADVAYTLQIGRSVFPHRSFLIGQQSTEVAEVLHNNDPHRIYTTRQEHRERTVAFLFPGVGEQYVGLTRELYQQEAVFRETIDRCSSLLKADLGLDLREILYPDDLPGQNGKTRQILSRNKLASTAILSEPLKQTAIAQPAVFVIEYALAQMFMQWGIRPQALMGYSLGEYVAACVAGVFSLPDALKLVTRRAQMIQATEPGAMIAVALSAESVQPYLDEQISLAATSGPATCVLSGPVEAIESLEQIFTEMSIIVRRIETTHAFHSSTLAALSGELTKLVGEITLHAPSIPYLSNVSGIWITDEQATNPAYWAQHMCQTVRFAEGLTQLLQETKHVLLEVGPGQSLSAFAKQHPACSKERLSQILPTLPAAYDRQAETASVLHALGKLWLAGVTLNWQALHAGEQRYRVPLPTYPFERQLFWLNEPKDWQPQATSTPQRTGKLADRADWFYLPAWEQVPFPPDQQEQEAEQQSPWLIFLDKYELGQQTAQRLQQAGHQCVLIRAGECFQKEDEWNYTIRPAEPTDYRILCKALASAGLMPKTVLHCWSLTGKDDEVAGASGFQGQQEQGLYSLLFLSQAFIAQVYEENVQILVVSNHLHAVTGQESIYPEKATIQAACRVIPQEQLNIHCRCIDIGTVGTDFHVSPRQITQLIAECTSNSRDPLVAYRGIQRWLQHCQPIRLPAPSAERTPFREQGVYLITGGLGNIGLLLADHLAKTCQARLVLTSRAGLPPRAEWAAHLEGGVEHEHVIQQIRQVQALENAGSQVLVIKADVAESTQMQAVIAQTMQCFGALHGVIHTAGISTGDGFRVVQDISRTECELQFTPKVYGLYALEQALQGIELDFCLLFSSISAILGGLSFLAYTAANVFMDAYTCKHNQTENTPWLCVNWDTWYKESMQNERMTTIAEYVMQPEEGIDAVTRVLEARHLGQIINSTGDLQTRIQQWVYLETYGANPEAHESVPGMARPDLSTAYAPASNEHEQTIIAIWQQVLGIEQIGIHDNFFELGGHSLIGTQVISRLRHAFQVNLPLMTLFESPTVAELTLSIKLILLEEIAKLDEEEVERLVG